MGLRGHHECRGRTRCGVPDGRAPVFNKTVFHETAFNETPYKDTAFIESGQAMKPAAFTYHAPSTISEALGLMDRYGDEAKVLAGGGGDAAGARGMTPKCMTIRLRYRTRRLGLDFGFHP